MLGSTFSGDSAGRMVQVLAGAMQHRSESTIYFRSPRDDLASNFM